MSAARAPPPPSALHTLGTIVRLGWPTTLTLCTQFAAPLCMLGTLGTLGPEFLGGGGMGFMYQLPG